MRIAGRTQRSILACVVAIALTTASVNAYQSTKPVSSTPLTPAVRAALDRISPDSLRGHLSFIASDLLEGRNTPSRGLDIAAEYIAAQFRRAGLEPVGDDGYFQTANWKLSERDLTRFEFVITNGNQTARVSPNQVSFTLPEGLNLSPTAIIKVDFKNPTALDAPGSAMVAGKTILTEMPPLPRGGGADTTAMRQAQTDFLNKAASLKAAAILSVDRNNPVGNAGGIARLIDPESPPNGRAGGGASASPVPLITIHSPEAIRLLDALRAGPTDAKVTLAIPAPDEKPVKLHNVIGVLRGSDPALKDTYVLVTAHYDHLGMREGTGDQIFNGANDDGSGTVSVVEIASALSTLKVHPKRTLVFMTVFGEEKGLLGSRYYGRHPIFPIAKTIADVNLEQVGRTDSTEGPQLNNASMTGFDFSDVGTIFEKAGQLTGITVYKHPENSDAYFGRSDNQALADQGVPAHTLCVAFDYPDYHKAGDHYDKIDYNNMAKVDRMVALGLVMIANNSVAPKWNEANPKTAKYVEAWKKQHSGR